MGWLGHSLCQILVVMSISNVICKWQVWLVVGGIPMTNGTVVYR